MSDIIDLTRGIGRVAAKQVVIKKLVFMITIAMESLVESDFHDWAVWQTLGGRPTTEAELFDLGRALGLGFEPLSPPAAPPPAAPLVASRTSLAIKLAEAALAFLLCFFLFGGEAAASPTNPPTPTTAPAAPSQPAPQPTNVQPVLPPAKKEEDMIEPKMPEPFPVMGPSAPVMRPNAMLQGSEVTQVEVNYLSSVGKTGLELLAAQPAFVQWLRVKLEKKYAEKDVQVYDSDLDVLSDAFGVTTPREDEDLVSWTAAAIPLGYGLFRGANSSIAFKAWKKRQTRDKVEVVVPTAIGLLFESIGDVVDCTQYGVSMLGASQQGLGFVDSEGNPEVDLHKAGIAVVAWDFDKPIGKTVLPNGEEVDLYLPSQGSDGELVVTQASPGIGLAGASKMFQVRGVCLTPEKKVTILKGAMEAVNQLTWAKGELWTPAKVGWEKLTQKEKDTPVLVPDTNTAFKGAGKNAYTHGQMITDPVFAWSIVDWATGTEESRPLELTKMSFQLTLFFTKQALAKDHLWDEMALTEEEISRVIKAAAELPEDWQDLQAVFKQAGAEIAPDQLAKLYSRQREKFVELMASGTRQKTRLLKVLANRLVPHGHCQLRSDMVHEGQAQLSTPRAAMSRMPAISPSSITAPHVITDDRLADFCDEGWKVLDAKVPNQSDDSFTWGRWLQSIIDRHNHVVEVNGWKGAISTKEEITRRLFRLHAETKFSCMDGVVRVNPIDGTLRNEDNDGDSSTCDTTPVVAQAYAAVEKHWDRFANRFIIEMPKGDKRPWTDPSVLGDFGRLGLPYHPKGCTPLVAFKPMDGLGADAAGYARAVAEVVSTSPQGPVGMWSNIAADLFLRIRWVPTKDDKFTYAEECENLFYAWVFACVHCQFAIDWQKRVYALLSVERFKEVAKAFCGPSPSDAYKDLVRKYGALGQESRTNFGKGGNGGEKELADNWCTAPEIPYAFAAWVANMGRDTQDAPAAGCWKFSSKKSHGWDFRKVQAFANACPDDSGTLSVYSHALKLVFKASGIATQVMVEEGKKEAEIRKAIGAILAKNAGPHLGMVVGTINAAMREIAASNAKLGDEQMLRKLSAMQVLSSWINFHGFSTADREALLNGETVGNGSLTKWTFFAAAFGHETPYGSLPLWQVVAEAFVSKGKKDAVHNAYALLGERYEMWFAAKGGKAAGLRALAAKSAPVLAGSQWVCSTVTEQVEGWAALDNALTANLPALHQAIWNLLGTQMPETNGSYLDALKRPYEDRRKALLVRFDEEVARMKEVIPTLPYNGEFRNRKSQPTIPACYWQWDEVRGIVRKAKGVGGQIMAKQDVEKAFDRAIPGLKRQVEREMRAIEREFEKLLEQLFTPIKRAWVTARTMSQARLNSKLSILGKPTTRALHFCGITQVSAGERPVPVLDAARNYPAPLEAGFTAGYEERFSTDPLLAIERWARAPFAIGPSIPVKEALAFASPLLMAGEMVKSYSAFPDRNIVTLDLLRAVFNAEGSAWSKNAAFRHFGKRVGRRELVNGAADLIGGNVALDKTAFVGNLVKVIAEFGDSDGSGFVPPVFENQSKRSPLMYSLLADAVIAKALELYMGDRYPKERLLEPENPVKMEDPDHWVREVWLNELAHYAMAILRELEAQGLPRATHANGDLVKAIKESWWKAAAIPQRLMKVAVNGGEIPDYLWGSWVDTIPTNLRTFSNRLAAFGWR